MRIEKDNSPHNPSVTRRTFLQATGALASAAMVSEVFIKSSEAAPAMLTGQNPVDTIETADDILYTVCQMCHSRCGVRAKVKEGILVKLDGNPYHPNNLDVAEDYTPARLPYGTNPSAAFKSIGRMCLKGQAGIQTVYDPYRIQRVAAPIPDPAPVIAIAPIPPFPPRSECAAATRRTSTRHVRSARAAAC